MLSKLLVDDSWSFSITRVFTSSFTVPRYERAQSVDSSTRLSLLWAPNVAMKKVEDGSISSLSPCDIDCSKSEINHFGTGAGPRSTAIKYSEHRDNVLMHLA